MCYFINYFLLLSNVFFNTGPFSSGISSKRGSSSLNPNVEILSIFSLNAFKSLNPFEVVSTGLDDIIVRFNTEENVIGRYDGYHGWWFNIGEPGDYTAGHTAFRTNKITLYLKRIGFDELGLYETTHANNEFYIHKTVTLNDYIYCQPAYYIDGTTLHLFTNITGFDGGSYCCGNYDALRRVLPTCIG